MYVIRKVGGRWRAYWNMDDKRRARILTQVLTQDEQNKVLNPLARKKHG